MPRGGNLSRDFGHLNGAGKKKIWSFGRSKQSEFEMLRSLKKKEARGSGLNSPNSFFSLRRFSIWKQHRSRGSGLSLGISIFVVLGIETWGFRGHHGGGVLWRKPEGLDPEVGMENKTGLMETNTKPCFGSILAPIRTTRN